MDNYKDVDVDKLENIYFNYFGSIVIHYKIISNIYKIIYIILNTRLWGI